MKRGSLDIVDFGLEDATDLLAATEMKRAQDALQSDPFIMARPEWIAAIKQLLQMGVRAEQQALAQWGLNYIINECLPRKLANASGFLPSSRGYSKTNAARLTPIV